MSNLYTTGELAKLCGVSVRTVQYYDGRGLLVPSVLSEGGRRLYTENDLRLMKIICFLRETGLPINSIAAILKEEKPESIIDVLLNEQEDFLRRELSERQAQLTLLEGIKRELKELPNVCVESIGDIAKIMKKKNKLKKMRWTMVLTGIPVTVLQWVSIILWIVSGLWWLFAVWACIAIPWGTAVSVYYFRRIAYICPECHETFKPKLKEALFAYHTPRMRRLICPKCGRKGLCVEVYAEKKDGENNG